jgi:hypothetical protein
MVPAERGTLGMMQTVYYDKAKLFGWAFVALVLGGHLAYFASTMYGDYGLMFLAAAVALLLCVPLLVMKGISDGVALSSDGRSLVISTLLRRKRVPWRDIMSIEHEEVEHTQALGLIRHKLADYVAVRVIGGVIGSHKLRIHCQLLEARYAKPDVLVRMLEAARGEAGEAGENAVFADEPRAAGDFDPDAIMARYLAKKGGAAGAPPQPEAPQRPVFGRKTA